MYSLSFPRVFQTIFFIKSMYISSCKIPENLESASLTVLNEVLPYTGYTMTPCMQKVFIATYICLLQHIFVYMIIHTYVVFDPRRTLFDSGEQRKILNLQLELCIVSLRTWTQPFFVIRWWYPNSCCQWHEEDLSESLIKDTRWKVMVILGYWTLHHFHTQTLQSSRLVRLMILPSLRQ